MRSQSVVSITLGVGSRLVQGYEELEWVKARNFHSRELILAFEKQQRSSMNEAESESSSMNEMNTESSSMNEMNTESSSMNEMSTSSVVAQTGRRSMRTRSKRSNAVNT